MKRLLTLFVVLLILIPVISSGCSENQNIIEKPDLKIDGIGGYAGKVHYLTIKKAGLKCILYYSITDYTFAGILENTGKKDAEGILISINDNDGNLLTEIAVENIKGSSAIEIDEVKVVKDFEAWTVDLQFEGKGNDAEQVTIIDDRISGGKLVSFDSILIKEYKEFVVRKNQGTNYRGHMYAGRHQKYILEEGKLVVEIKYDYNTLTFSGTVSNTGKITQGYFGIHLLFNTGEMTEVYGCTSLKPLSVKEFRFEPVDWREFEIYRPIIEYYGSYIEPDMKTSVEIEDVF